MVIRIENEWYDYTGNEVAANGILTEVEELTNKQRLALHGMVEQLKTTTATEELQKQIERFDIMILPVLKEFAEKNFSCLEVERDQSEIIQVTFRNANGFEISNDFYLFRSMLSLAALVIFDVEDSDPILVLTYDCKRFVI